MARETRKVSLFKEEHGSVYGGRWDPYGTYDRGWWSFTKRTGIVVAIVAVVVGIGVGIAFAISAGDRAGCHDRWVGYDTRHSMFGGCVVEVAPDQWLPEEKVNRGDFRVEVSQ